MLLDVPVAVGFPTITPSVPRVKPFGKLPEVFVQELYVPLPPVAVSLNE